MPQNIQPLVGGSSAVGAMLTVFLDKFAMDLTLEEFAMVTAGLAAVITFLVKRIWPPKEEPVVLTQVVEEPGKDVAVGGTPT